LGDTVELSPGKGNPSLKNYNMIRKSDSLIPFQMVASDPYRVSGGHICSHITINPFI